MGRHKCGHRPPHQFRSPPSMSAPVLSFPEKAGQGCPALAVLAAAKLAGVDLEVKALDAKAAKDAPVALTFPSGCAAHMPRPAPCSARPPWAPVPPLGLRPIKCTRRRAAGRSWWACPASCASSPAPARRPAASTARMPCPPARCGGAGWHLNRVALAVGPAGCCVALRAAPGGGRSAPPSHAAANRSLPCALLSVATAPPALPATCNRRWTSGWISARAWCRAPPLRPPAHRSTTSSHCAPSWCASSLALPARSVCSL